MFKVKDYDQIGKNDELGYVNVSSLAIYGKLGQNMELKLTPPPNVKGKKADAGYITIHCRHYNPKDPNDQELREKFLSKMNKQSSKTSAIASIVGNIRGEHGEEASPIKEYSGLPPPSPSTFHHKHSKNHAEMSLKSMRLWDVKMPPVKKHMLQGYLVPTMTGSSIMSRLASKRRRLTLEVYQTKEAAASASAAAQKASGHGDGDGAPKSPLYRKLLKGISVSDGLNDEDSVETLDQQFALDESDEVIVRVLKAKRKNNAANAETSSTTSEPDESGNTNTEIRCSGIIVLCLYCL